MVALDVGDLPSELTASPLANVALLGLDVTNNSIHRAIWESFTANRSERAPLSLKLIPEGYEFPVAKPKRTSYDWYVPKGILKTNWMNKHLTEIPSVAIQFVELDWDTPAWVEKRAECYNKLQNLRASLQGRSTRIALVLIQNRAALPGTDDQLAAERAAFLCSSCDLSGKTLFVLPHSDHLYGYTLRLQNAFYELAQTYYHHESRRIKNHRDHLNKTTHQLLFVRHQFKIAFLSELKQEAVTALKNYKQAYANLMEVRATDANMLEIKTIAGFINYKICRLSFMNGAPLDAIAQFRKHIDIFKNKLGAPELAFEHSAWMSKQFSHFGDLFEEAVHQSLNAIQTQHPGFYYQQAANHAMTRKMLCHKLCKSVPEPANFSVLEGADTLEFYGQRPWRPCCQSLEPPDPQKEQEGIQALKYKELHEVDHSMTIIPLLSSAVSQFKKYKCPRMKRQLTVEMGEEYYYYKDYSKALTLLKHVLWDYRLEKWRPIVSSILWIALKCAYLSANVQEYISLSLEAISYWILRSSEEKSTVQMSIKNLIQGKQPGPFPGIPEQELKLADAEWAKNLASLEAPRVFTLQMSSLIPFVECKACFECPDYVVDQRVTVVVHIRLNCPQPMTFTKLTVLFNNPCYNKFCEVPSADEKEKNPGQDFSAYMINLVPRNIHTYTFNFILDPNDIDNEIQITSVALQLGSESTLCTVLHWIVCGTNSSSSLLASQFITKATSFSDDPSFQHIVSQPSTKVLPRSAKLNMTIEHEIPALIDEFYVFCVSVTNEELTDIENVHLSVGLKPGQPQIIHDSTHLCEECFQESFVQYLPKIPLKKLSPGETVKKNLFMKASAVGLRHVTFEASYEVDVESDEQLLHCICRKAEDVEVEVVEPFDFSIKLLNMKCQEMVSVRAEEPFLLRVDITSCSVVPVALEDARIELGKDIYSVDGSLMSVVQDLSLKPGEAGTECFCLMTQENCAESVPLGVYYLKWKRKSLLNDFVVVETEVDLPAINVTKTPIYIELEHPANGCVCTPLTITYLLHNRLTTVQDVEVLVDSSDAFMYSGNKQVHFRVLPRDKYKLLYNLYPLVPGYVPLPRLRMILNPQTAEALPVDDLIRDMVPTHIFVMPQGKGASSDILL